MSSIGTSTYSDLKYIIYSETKYKPESCKGRVSENGSLFSDRGASLFRICNSFLRNRDSAVGIATGYGLDGRRLGDRIPVDFPPIRVVHTGSGTHQASYLLGTGALSPGVKRPGREAGHLFPTSALVKNSWIYTFTPPYFFMA
jgi:hypothetical protein